MVKDRTPLNKLISILLLITGSVLLLKGQTPMISSGQELFNYMHSDHDYIIDRLERYTSVEGSPCINEEFVRGAVFHNGTKYVDLDLRYNNFEGYFEFRVEDRIRYFSPDLTRLDTVWAGEDIFLYVDYLEGNHRKQTFMKLLYNGEISVLLRNELILIQAEPASGYKAARPARFEAAGEEIYLQREGQPAIAFRGRKSIRNLFPDHQKELLNYAKKEKLRLKNPDEIIRLCRFFENLN